jgi:hypothetical protein
MNFSYKKVYNWIVIVFFAVLYIACGSPQKGSSTSSSNTYSAVLGTYSGSLVGNDSISGIFFTVVAPITAEKNHLIFSRTGSMLMANIKNDSVQIPAQKSSFLTPNLATVTGKGLYNNKTLSLEFRVHTNGDEQTLSGKFKQE